MRASLIVRYSSDWPAVYTPAGQVIYEGPRKQDQLIALARRQVDAQRAAAAEITESNIEAAQIIASEIERQTESLGQAIGGMSMEISEAVRDSSAQVTRAVDRLGDRICASFTEVKWQLLQQGKTLDKLLETLLNSRTNEAQQLVRQGLRHYASAEYAEAEERFLKALEKDSTDYQVLLNLAFIEIHKGNSEAAHRWFRKAVSLPEELDSEAKARTLWADARLYKVDLDPTRAFALASEALETEGDEQAASLYLCGVYAGLAGDLSRCTHFLERAVKKDRSFFTRAAVDPALTPLRPTVLKHLSEMASRAKHEADFALSEARAAFERAAQAPHASKYWDLLKAVRDELGKVDSRLSLASYGDCLAAKAAAIELNMAASEVEGLGSLQADLERAMSKGQDLQTTHARVQADCLPLLEQRPVSQSTAGAVGWVAYLLPGVLGLASHLTGHREGCFGIVAGPLFWPIIFLYALFTRWQKPAGRFLLGATAGIVIDVVLWYLLVLRPKQRFIAVAKENARRSQLLAESEQAITEGDSTTRYAQALISEQRAKVSSCVESARSLLHRTM